MRIKELFKKSIFWLIFLILLFIFFRIYQNILIIKIGSDLPIFINGLIMFFILVILVFEIRQFMIKLTERYDPKPIENKLKFTSTGLNRWRLLGGVLVGVWLFFIASLLLVIDEGITLKNSILLLAFLIIGVFITPWCVRVLRKNA